ncbi:methyl-accepting chemotaxis protein [Marinobacter sp. X15-166B]|uniref:methyl-accepting chemotaxis protein n=1 Tax=Marinobacter sp. X15-166B TaxID=1897620 RepID=UPI00085BFDCC|nr:methyl-accepting chemotaxis protein [Marinobacter sp. X15-166B]OEY66297.1 hypothetical protein BG841_07390 [Marinobacter sp. X15-166B]
MWQSLLRLTIARRLLFWAFLASALFYSAVLLGWYGLQSSRDSLREVYREHQAAMLLTVEMDQLLSQNRLFVMLAFHFDPRGRLYLAHSRPLSTYIEQIRSNSETIEGLRRRLMDAPMTDAEQALMKAFDEQYDIWREDLEAMLELLEIEDFGELGMTLFLRVGAPAGEAASDVLAQLLASQRQKTAAVTLAAEQDYERIVALYVGLAVFGLIAGTLTGLATLRRLRRGFAQVTASARAIADGDLARPLPPAGGDEIGQLLEEQARMQRGLQTLIGQMRAQVGVLGRSAETLKADARTSSDRARQQSDALTTISAAVEELSASIAEVGGHGESTRGIVQRAANHSQESEAAITQMVDEMLAMSTAVTDTAERMQELDVFSRQIDSVIGVINEVAEQTNLLSLNAAIEAARAGEHGRGFAVVAGEVRGLARRTSQSTVEITATVQQIQQATRRALTDMQDTVTRVEAGVDSARHARVAIADIRAGTDEIIRAVNEISELLNSQALTTREIAAEVESVTAGVVDMSGSAERSSGSAERLTELAVELEGQAARFRLTELTV